MLGQCGKVCGVVIHIVAAPSLARSFMPATVVGNDPKAVVVEEQHLRIPIVGAQWPAMAKYDRLAGATAPARLDRAKTQATHLDARRCPSAIVLLYFLHSERS